MTRILRMDADFCSCATLLLHAGAPILTVQALLGHEHIDTILRYA